MLSDLKSLKKVIGAKQTKRAITSGEAREVYIARDAEARVIAPLRELCAERGVTVVEVDTMRELGTACGIEVGAAIAAVLG